MLESELVNVLTAEGLQAELDETHWEAHVIKGHPELAPYRKLVIETLQSPDGVYRSKHDSTTRIYAKNYQKIRIGETIQERISLHVFVRESGFVATAYFVAAAWRGLGERIWPS